MYEFKYYRPETVRQAANLLIKNEDAKLIAGGHTLVPVMKQRLASPPHLVDLSHIEGLNTIELKGRALVIGATATHAEVANSAVVGEAIPALAYLAVHSARGGMPDHGPPARPALTILAINLVACAVVGIVSSHTGHPALRLLRRQEPRRPDAARLGLHRHRVGQPPSAV